MGGFLQRRYPKAISYSKQSAVDVHSQPPPPLFTCVCITLASSSRSRPARNIRDIIDSSMDSSHSPNSNGRDAAEKRVSYSTEPTASASVSSTPKQHPPPQRSPSASNINVSSHRQSFADNLRNGPSSPRHRHPSFTQAAVQDLMNHPPTNRQANPKFAGKDWRDITAGELVSQDDIRWIELDSSVEEATVVCTFVYVA